MSRDNPITSLDVSFNSKLRSIVCYDNELTSLDVSQNDSLTSLNCYDNPLTSLDLSNNKILVSLACTRTLVTSLDLRNGNNHNMSNTYINITQNPDLFCISVDDVEWSKDNWIKKDSWASFSNNCTLGITDIQINQPSITTMYNAITISGRGTASIYNLKGQRVHHSKLNGKSSISLNKGMYLVSVVNQGRSTTKKVYLK
ncbi:MAG: T9SS type A sorting domain-containing protein [Flavobacteriales bacterium]|nr:T9SS type A sorting domain-containing protein [Flavobacteriales bacterium]